MKYKHIIFDFDGTLAETNAIRLDGFRVLFKEYPQSQVDELICYSQRNGGTSRYERIGYFFEKIRNVVISYEEINVFAEKYSKLVKEKVIAAVPVNGSLEFLTLHVKDYNFAVISGSDQQELREVCRARKIEPFFVEILGSPTNKEQNLAELLTRKRWKKDSSLFVGDSINDLNAAESNGIDFVGCGSFGTDWNLNKNICLIDDLSQLEDCLN
ncbi:MAG: HAD hydrolase-like protein [Candidatus Omnitrophota bacterium]